MTIKQTLLAVIFIGGAVNNAFADANGSNQSFAPIVAGSAVVTCVSAASTCGLFKVFHYMEVNKPKDMSCIKKSVRGAVRLSLAGLCLTACQITVMGMVATTASTIGLLKNSVKKN